MPHSLDVSSNNPIAIRYLDGRRLQRATRAGAQWLIQQQKRLNDINVFPVPDGDTGTNMAFTMRSVMERIAAFRGHGVDEVSESLADAALMGARGNSGAILAQFFQGLAEGMKGRLRISTEDFAHAVKVAATWSREAVTDPKEGTILTVIQDWASHVWAYAPSKQDFGDLIRSSLVRAKESLQNTPKQLKVLQKAGVVDAGAQGFVYFLEGVLNYIEQGKIEDEPELFVLEEALATQIEHDPSAITFQYCTECLIEGEALNRPQIRALLETFGDSLIVAGSRQKVRVHVHTNEPKMAFQALEAFGKVSHTKAEDMRQQHTDAFHIEKAEVALVVDSGCDLPPSMIEQFNIKVVPLQLSFGEQFYSDGVTIDAKMFYEKLKTDSHHPKSSQPSPADFDRVYSRVMDHYESAISLHVPEILSGTIQGARRAIAKYDDRISIVDAKSVSIGMGLVAQTGIQAIQQGENRESVVQAMQKDVTHLQTFIALPTTDFLLKGGRMGKMKGLLGRFLKLKPILAFKPDGTLDLVGKVMGKQDVYQAMLDMIKAKIGDRKGLRMAVGHANAPELGAQIAEKVQAMFEPSELMTIEISPVLAVHGGPNTAGIAFILD